MAWDIIFFSLAGPVGDYTGAHSAILRRLFSIYYSPEKNREAAMGGSGGGGGHYVFRRVRWVGRGVQWKDRLLAAV
jgi:hypothetical protein